MKTMKAKMDRLMAMDTREGRALTRAILGWRSTGEGKYIRTPVSRTAEGARGARKIISSAASIE